LRPADIAVVNEDVDMHIIQDQQQKRWSTGSRLWWLASRLSVSSLNKRGDSVASLFIGSSAVMAT
jgi:hypothetical protein